MIEWQGIEFWPPKARRFGEEFLFWQPTVPGVAPARYVVASVLPSSISPALTRTTTAWARLTPPLIDEETAKTRLVAALCLVEAGNSYLSSGFWGPSKADARAAILGALSGRRVAKSKAGFNAFRDALYAAVKPEGASENATENDFSRRVAAILREVDGE